MAITITARHVSIGEDIKGYARSHLEELVELRGHDTSAHMIIDSEKKGYLAEINLQAGHRQINCKARDRDLQTAVNQVLKKSEKRLKKIKGKKFDRRKAKEPAPASPDDLPRDIPKLIKDNDFQLKTMPEREASLRLREENLNFLVYQGAESGRLSIIYRRRDGQLGLIEPR